MKAWKGLVWACAVPAFVSFLPAAAAAAQGGTPLQKAIEAFDAAYKARQDEAVSKAVGTIIEAYLDPATSDAEKPSAIGALGKALKYAGKDGRITMAAAQGLAGMGPDAAKPLLTVMKEKRFRKEESLKQAYLAMIRALGATKTTRDYKTLLDLLKDKDNDVIAAAAEALGNYTDVKQSIRKRVAESMIRILDGAYNAARADQRNTTLQKKYEVIGMPLFSALQKVTGASVNSAPGWRRWFNENKKKRWK